MKPRCVPLQYCSECYACQKTIKGVHLGIMKTERLLKECRWFFFYLSFWGFLVFQLTMENRQGSDILYGVFVLIVDCCFFFFLAFVLIRARWRSREEKEMFRSLNIVQSSSLFRHWLETLWMPAGERCFIFNSFCSGGLVTYICITFVWALYLGHLSARVRWSSGDLPLFHRKMARHNLVIMRGGALYCLEW